MKIQAIPNQRRKIKSLLRLVALLCFLILAPSSCKTKSDLRHEQELERLKAEVQEARGERADVDTTAQELRHEISRLAARIDEQARRHEDSIEILQKEMGVLIARIQAVEQKPAPNNEGRAVEKAKATYASAKAFFDDKKYDQSIVVLKELLESKPGGEERKRSQYLLAESYFLDRDYRAAALEFSEYKKTYPHSPAVPGAIYRQAHCFRNLGKPKEARLFYQELIENHPKHPLALKAKQELKKFR